MAIAALLRLVRAGYVLAREGAFSLLDPEPFPFFPRTVIRIGRRIARRGVDRSDLAEGLTAAGLTIYGGRHAPYIWIRTPAGLSSWEFFDKLLGDAHVLGVPGSGFGPSGEGYFRLTAFGSREQTEEAVERIATRL